MEKGNENQAELFEQQTAPAATKNEDFPIDLAAISVQSRLLPFWREYPDLWFNQFEALVLPMKTSDEHTSFIIITPYPPHHVSQLQLHRVHRPLAATHRGLVNILNGFINGQLSLPRPASKQSNISPGQHVASAPHGSTPTHWSPCSSIAVPTHWDHTGTDN